MVDPGSRVFKTYNYRKDKMKQNRTRIIKMNNARHMVITPKARLSFPNLFKPREKMDGNGLEYSCDLIWETKDELKVAYKGKKIQTVSLMQASINAKKDQWGPDKDAWPDMKYTPFKDGNESINKETGKVRDGYKDGWFIQAKSAEKFPPKILSKAGKPLTENDVYGGCFVQAQLMARPYSFGGNHGIRFLLLCLMKLEDGERFGGGGNNAMFDVTEEDDSDMEINESEDGSDDEEDGDDF